MSLSGLKDQDKKGNYKGKCVYLMMLIKQKNTDVWKRLQADFQTTSIDETYKFYETLLLELKQLQENKNKDLGPVSLPEAQIASTVNSKKVAKEKTKKKEEKKEEEKQDKTTKKKAAKKKTKKKVAKKTVAAKKTTKKSTAAKKKTTKKKTKKKK